MKSCTKCNITKEFNDFHKNTSSKDGHLTVCKSCIKAYQTTNKDKLKESRQKHYRSNKEEILKRQREWRKDNNDKYLLSCKKSRQKNKKKIHIKYKERLKRDPLFALRKRIRTRISDYFNQRNLNKNKSSRDMVGLTFKDLFSYLESTFVENYGILPEEWMDIHIDHIIPLSTADKKQELEQLNFFTNLQLLFSDDNIKKSDRILKR